MSKQLAISAAASVFAMVVFVLAATPDMAGNEAGAMAHAAAPASTSVSLAAVGGLQSIIR